MSGDAQVKVEKGRKEDLLNLKDTKDVFNCAMLSLCRVEVHGSFDMAYTVYISVETDCAVKITFGFI